VLLKVKLVGRPYIAESEVARRVLSGFGVPKSEQQARRTKCNAERDQQGNDSPAGLIRCLDLELTGVIWPSGQRIL
jgi:hypothetical protein